MTFGFRVKRGHDWIAEEFRHKDEPNGLWYVALPHQCDAWQIAGDMYRGSEKADVINEFADFLAEAQEAFWALMKDQEYGSEE